jgi:hypothetical protein
MLLIAEIWLTIRAWRKGWKGWALLPAGCTLVLAFSVGVALGDTSLKEANLFSVGLILDLLLVGVLAVMNFTTPEKKEKEDKVLDYNVSVES